MVVSDFSNRLIRYTRHTHTESAATRLISPEYLENRLNPWSLAITAIDLFEYSPQRPPCVSHRTNLFWKRTPLQLRYSKGTSSIHIQTWFTQISHFPILFARNRPLLSPRTPFSAPSFSSVQSFEFSRRTMSPTPFGCSGVVGSWRLSVGPDSAQISSFNKTPYQSS